MQRISRRSFVQGAPALATLLVGGSGAQESKIARHDPPAISKSRPADFQGTGFPITATPFWEVNVTDAFWAPKIATNSTVTIPFELQKLKRFDDRLSGGVLEAALFSLKTRPDGPMQLEVDRHIQALARSEVDLTTERGFEVATAHYRMTGHRELLEKAMNKADALISDFKKNDPPFSGGERDALSCVDLYRTTGEKKYLALARHFLDIRGRADSVGRSRHNQSYKPVHEQTEAVGHAVNCVTLMLSLVDYGVLSGHAEYYDAGQRMWEDAVRTKLYLTGGVGSTGNEGFGESYVLPNISSYSETCAVLMFMTLSHRLFLATGDSRYLDVMERGLYNNAIAGASVSGDHFFYVNRLASAGDGRDTRWQHASLECCPPNLVRFFASMPGLFYAQARDNAVYVNLYVSGSTTFHLGGQNLLLRMESRMPWSGESSIEISTAKPLKGTLKLRIPGWARNVPAPGGIYSYAGDLQGRIKITLNGQTVAATPEPQGYVSLEREWRNGDRIEVDFPVEARRVTADSRVTADRRRMAVERGPIVYCAEWPDVQGGQALTVMLPVEEPLNSSFDTSFFGGATLIQTSAKRVNDPSAPAQPLTLIPYFLWANRGAGEMNVWLAAAEHEARDLSPSGGIIFYKNPNFAADGWRYLEAAPFDQSGGAPWGCFRREIRGARATALGTGKQNTADMLAGCNEPGGLSAAHLCANFSLNGVKGWFLPSRDELAEMYKALKIHGLGNFQHAGMPDNCEYWTSTQNDADMAGHIDFADAGRVHGDDKDFPRRVRAVRAF